MSRTRKDRGYFGHHRKRGYPVCTGCTACSWYPERLTRAGRRTAKVLKREVAAELSEAS